MSKTIRTSGGKEQCPLCLSWYPADEMVEPIFGEPCCINCSDGKNRQIEDNVRADRLIYNNLTRRK